MQVFLKQLFAFIHIAFILSACTSTNRNTNISINPTDFTLKNMHELHNVACLSNTKNHQAWGVNSLYDCSARELYIPYQLWTGAVWNGQKTNNCLHSANSTFNVDGDSLTTIKGPKDWSNPKSGKVEKVWVRDKVDGSKSQYFTCHEKGIGRVYDSRRSKHYLSGRCKFPAGKSWGIDKRGYCKSTAIQITEMSFNQNGVLQAIKFKWWVGDVLDHIYQYKPNYGMTNAWKQ